MSKEFNPLAPPPVSLEDLTHHGRETLRKTNARRAELEKMWEKQKEIDRQRAIESDKRRVANLFGNSFGSTRIMPVFDPENDE